MGKIFSSEQPMQSDDTHRLEWIVIRVTDNRDTFSVATYNILADAYSGYQNYCESSLLKLEYRLPILTKEISEFNTDFICLQEVDTYDQHFKGLFDTLGYGSQYVKRPNQWKRDGSLIAWKSDKWAPVESLNFNYNDTEKCAQDKYYSQDNIGILIVFQNIATQDLIIIGTSHLYWDPQLEYVKFFQAKVFTERACELKDKYQCEVVLTGDFNSLPDSQLINFMINKPLKLKGGPNTINGKIKEMYEPSRLKLKACY